MSKTQKPTNLSAQEQAGIKISWPIKFFLKFFPTIAMHLFARKMGIKEPMFDQLHEAFFETKRIDFFPLGGTRGFMLILDRKTSLWFYQKNDHFIYDGYEMGEYEKGDVTIFDRLG